MKRVKANTDALLEAVDRSGLKLQSIAREMGITRTSLYRKSRNMTSWQSPEVDKFCKIVGVRNKAERESIFFVEKCD